jgi:phenylpropionate dioxygenase-like ring-hydroxylating dioxygenase large terminal subunit
MNQLEQTQELSQATLRLLHEMRGAAARPLEEAVALPPSAYASNELYELEMSSLFPRSWLCVGRFDELQNPGDYVTFEIAGQPVVAILQPDGRIRTFANVCLHRSAPLLQGRGNTSRLVCPYHAWSYDCQGQLLAAPFMDGARDFKPRGRRLAEVRTEVWEGWVYVTLDPDIAPVAEQLLGLQKRLAIFDMGRQQQIFRKDEVWRTNWKSLAENFMESYHLFRLHSTTVEPEMPTKTTVCVEGEGAYCLHYFDCIPGSAIGTAHASKTQLSEEERRKHYDACIFPSHLVAGGHNFIFWLSLYPRSASEVHVRWGVTMAPEHLADVADREQYIRDNEGFFDAVNLEDRTLLESMQTAQHAPLTKSGRLSLLERPLWEFQKYLARMLAPLAQPHASTAGGVRS